ncbi:MAG: 30S ribosomal protein S8 [Alphaproteobacteria bacterium]|jgi:small subunit ribosomal protein S8|nr:30S ribosomal protein S8 [Alphaproteobacteria bacterium]
MTISDPIGDLLTRIRNAQRVGKKDLMSPYSNARANVLNVLAAEGYIRGFSVVKNESGRDELKVELKYLEGQPVIRTIERVSKPGRRVYSSIKDLKLVSNGLGINILSTSEGVMSDVQARKKAVGGEVICTVF